MSRVLLLRTDNRIAVDHPNPQVYSIVTPALTYQHKEWYQGYEKRQAIRAGLPPFEETTVEVFTEDQKGRIVTLAGYEERLRHKLTAAGYEVVTEVQNTDRPLPAHPDAYEPVFDNIFGGSVTQLRP